MRGQRRILVFAVVLAGCAALTGIDGYEIDHPSDASSSSSSSGSGEAGVVITDGGVSGGDGTAPTDAGADVFIPPPPPCDASKPFGAPVKLASLALGGDEGALHFLPDERTVFFAANRKEGLQNELWTATRPAITDSFTNITRLTFASSSSEEKDPMVTANGLTLFFARNENLWVATRTSTTEPFSQTELKDLNKSRETAPFYFEAEKLLYFSSNQGGGFRIYRSAFVPGGMPAAPTQAGGLNTTDGDDVTPVLSPNGLTIYFASSRPGGKGSTDLWRATRGTLSDPWSNLTILPNLSSANEDFASWISADDCRLYFHSNREGSFHAYVATRPL